MYSLSLPSNIFAGFNSLNKVCDILKKENVNKLTIFTDSTIKTFDFFKNLINEIEKSNIDYIIIDNLTIEPSYKDVEIVMEKLDNSKTDFIIAIGGGSVLDIAKLCSILKDAPYGIKDLIKDPSQGTKNLKTLMIPTTCGTGSEATCNSIVTVPEDGIKVGIVNQGLIPDYVILDPITVKELPKNLIASTGVDALAHCIECLTSKKATPFSNLYSFMGAELIFKNIREAYLNPSNIEARANILLGSFYGGIAITSSGTTAVHALAYPLGGKFHVPHGISNAIMIGPVMEFNKEACLSEFSRLCDILNPSMFDLSSDQKADYIISEIKDILKVTNIPVNLSEFGVGKKDLEFLVSAASKVTRLLNNNLKELSIEDIKNIYLKVLD
ncbi:iron-containing alcohol dehydrogenase [Cetobacterium sp.]|uniref:iron-containing alcohol dehydrogenase n=1 Tax=Cetobacterium sp. TaxID=2071632 RepID=UPI003F396B45